MGIEGEGEKGEDCKWLTKGNYHSLLLIIESIKAHTSFENNSRKNNNRAFNYLCLKVMSC